MTRDQRVIGVADERRLTLPAEDERLVREREVDCLAQRLLAGPAEELDHPVIGGDRLAEAPKPVSAAPRLLNDSAMRSRIASSSASM